MPLAIGTRLGAYEITALLGVGGMGEVYRATDTNLKRAVAIKVLPASVATDPERLARFKREAEVLGALNHPHIAQIYGVEKADGVTALVLELVEGSTLAERIARGPIPLDETLPIAKQIAEALEAAHEQGIVHRDLKPANIKVRPDGTVKVLDFGLAKAMEPAAGSSPNVSQSPTITTPAMTQAGMILGTAAYMSPEQARGKSVDKRADIWAFGSVLFEMLAGTRVFAGDDLTDTLAAIVRSEPTWTLLPSTTPPGLRRLLRRCLEKDPKQRLRDVGEFRLALASGFDSEPTAVAPTSQSRLALWRRLAIFSVPALVAGVVIGGWSIAPRNPRATASVSRLALPLPPDVELSYTNPSLAISADGTSVAYLGTRGGVQQIYIRRMDATEVRPLPGTEGASSVFFSPDGQWLGFVAELKLKKISTSGGVAVALTDGVQGGGDWGPNDTIVFRGSGERGILEIPAAGGAPHALVAMDGSGGRQGTPSLPRFLPGGRNILFAFSTPGGRVADERSIEILALDTGARKVVLQGGSDARYLPTGHLVFLRSGTLLAAPFDLDSMAVTGPPVPVIENVRESVTGVGAFDCATTGTCVYAAGGMAGARRMAVFVDRTGVSQPLPIAPQSYDAPKFSPAGDKIAFWLEREKCDVAVYETARGVLSRLSLDGDNHNPVWAPDGRRVTYVSQKSPGAGYEFYWKSGDGSGAEERVTGHSQKLDPIAESSWSPDGTVLAFSRGGDIWLLPSSGDGEIHSFFTSRATETTPAFSPDGHWLAYVSDESGRPEVYVRPFPGPGAKYVVSTDGGTEPAWARGGRELFFRNGGRMMVSQIAAGAGFSATRPSVLFTGSYVRGRGRAGFDVSPDGQRFVMLVSGDDQQSSSQVNVVLNWFEELKAKVPPK